MVKITISAKQTLSTFLQKRQQKPLDIVSPLDNKENQYDNAIKAIYHTDFFIY